MLALLQDAHNLAWKLAAAVQGQASEDLLKSYGAERRPIAQANADLSVANFQDAIRIPQALGLDPRAANFLHSAVSSLPASLFPSGEPTDKDPCQRCLTWSVCHVCRFVQQNGLQLRYMSAELLNLSA